MTPIGETPLSEATSEAAHRARGEKEAYAGEEPRPLGSYAVLMAAYGAGVLGLVELVRRSDVTTPERIGFGDLLLLGVATYKVSRLLAKDPVTSPMRAAFTTFEGVSGPSELREAPRGHGLRHAVGELAVCPFCLGQWVATGFVFGYLLRPRATRLVASVFGVISAADLLQFAHAAIQRNSDS